MTLSRVSIQVLRQQAQLGVLSQADISSLAHDPRRGARALAATLQRKLARAAAEDERMRMMCALEHELWARGVERIAGVDEAGAGPLAGPVFAAAVILPRGARIEGINDSKKVCRRQREELCRQIEKAAVATAVARCSAAEVDQLNIFQASRQAMKRAVLQLDPEPQYLLVDARRVPGVDFPQEGLVHGDARCQAIAAASILAKVHRDAFMEELAQRHPGYGFERHKGYFTEEHRQALARLGPCSEHRLSFAPLSSIQDEDLN